MTKDLSALNIDAVLCINLKSREDRRMAMLETFKDTGLNIEFFMVDKDVEDPQRGCYNSHMACARLVLERNYERALILEDDCIVAPFSPKTVQHVNFFLNKENPEIFYLGVLLGKMWLTWNKNVARCRAQGAHAYIISAQGCKNMLSWEAYTDQGIDSLFSKRFKGYCVFPMICFQNNTVSDIQSFRDVINNRQPQNKIIQCEENLYLKNKKKQFISVFRNFHKTLLFK